MKIKNLSVLAMSILITGCTTPLTLKNDYSKLSSFGYDEEEIVELSYCDLVMPKYNVAGVCILTKDGLGIYAGSKLGSSSNKDFIQKFKNVDINKIALKDKLRLRQVQVLADTTYFAFTLTPNQALIDADKTQKWYDYLIEDGVKSFNADSYMTGPVTSYQMKY
jgi:hypothetical protein